MKSLQLHSLWIFILIELFLIFHTEADLNVGDPIVCYNDGCVRGVDYGYYEAFMGIPFAKPPVGDLRFRNPVPVDKWDGVLNATEEKPVCTQKNVLFPYAQIEGTEDCLYLYVYRPKSKDISKLPVMIYIYGGGFFAGIAGPSIDGPEYFMETQQVVMVFMAYRVAALGFLSTGDEEMSGNFGLKDQALAIKWTAKNIEHFGGDPTSITVLGQSAGAASTHFHMFSPQTQNLFHRVILLSGTAIAPFSYVNPNPRQQANDVAMEAGIQNADKLSSKQLVEELRKLKVEDIIEASERQKLWDSDPIIQFHPVLENCQDSDLAFLCDDPRDLWRKGQHSKVPILAGFSQIEGAFRGLAIIEDGALVESLNKILPKYLTSIFDLEKSTSEETKNYLDKVYQVYLKGKNFMDSDNKFGLVDLYSERLIVQPLFRLAREYLSTNNENPLYIYKFNFTGPFSYSQLFTKTKEYYGAVHCDELIYTLRSPVLFPDFSPDSTETKFRKMWIDFLIGFVKEGKVLNSEPCEKFDITDPSKCPYIYFGRTSRTSDEIVITKKFDLPLKMEPFWKQMESIEEPIPNCDVFGNQNCYDKYCC